ncbi:MAG: hypothetical protein KBF93_08950 [Leptospiraceae bacterium]|nr:hypothetical protein [Leptospiraceae bacterium]
MLLKLQIIPKFLKFIYTLLFCCVLFLFTPSLFAKVTCTGEACNVLPQKYIAEFDKLDSAFQSQYLQPVMQSMIEAAVISNNSSGMIGVGYVNRFQVGAGLGAGYVLKEDITVTHADIKIPKLPNAGIAATPTVMFAFNLGWLLGKGPSLQAKPEKIKKVNRDNFEEEDEDEDEDDGTSILHRFNFYFHGMKANYYTTSDVKAAYGSKPEFAGGFALNSFGVMLRYQLIEPKISIFDLIGFSGVSVGLGYNSQKFSVDVTHNSNEISTVNFGELQGAWVAKTDFQFASSVKSVPIEVRTGIKLLYFFDFFCGVGLSRNYGTADLQLSRGGPVKLSLDPYYIYNTTLLNPDLYKYYNNNALNPGNSMLNPEGTLSMDFRQTAKVVNNTNYAIVGMELNFIFLKILAEAIILEKAYGANVGLKLAF